MEVLIGHDASRSIQKRLWCHGDAVGLNSGTPEKNPIRDAATDSRRDGVRFDVGDGVSFKNIDIVTRERVLRGVHNSWDESWENLWERLGERQTRDIA
jgi:hypothetical protein